MLRRFNPRFASSLTTAALFMGGATLLSRIIGFVRTRALTHTFGSSYVTDAYYAAFKLPDLIYNLLIVGALTTAFIPVWSALWHEHDDKTTAWRAASNCLNIIGIILIIAALIGIAGAGRLVHVIGYGFDPVTRAQTVEFMRIMFLSPIILGLSMVMGGVLQTLRQFALYAFAPILYNIGIIIGITELVPLMGVNGLAWGVVLGALGHFGIQWYGAYRAGFRWTYVLDWRAAYLKTIGKLMIPRTVGVAMTQINIVIITTLASVLPVGSMTNFNLANDLSAVGTGLIAIPFALAVFPLLTRESQQKNFPTFGTLAASTARQIIVLIIPFTVIFFILRAQVVRVILGSGAFDWDATVQTANALALLVVGLPAQALIPLLARSFYAMYNTATPLIAGVISEAVTIVLALAALSGYLGTPLQSIEGLCLATAIGAWTNAVLLTLALRRTVGPVLEERKTMIVAAKVLVSGGAMALVCQLTKDPIAGWVDMTRWWGVFVQGLGAGLAGFATYGTLAYLFEIEEWRTIVMSFKRRLFRVAPVTPTIDEGSNV